MRVQFKGFINVELNKEQKKQARELSNDIMVLYDKLQQLVLGEYDVKLSYDSKRYGYRCVIFGSAISADRGFAIGSISGSVTDAIAASLIKATVCCDLGHWGEKEQQFTFDL